MRSRFAIVLLALGAAVGCGGGNRPSGDRVVRVAAAADLKFALDDIATVLAHERPSIELQTTYGSSGNLYTQIVNSAPFDLFLSADAAYPRQLIDQGFTVPGSDFVYALGRLAIVAPVSSTLDLSQGMAALTRATRVAIANPSHAPYGRAALAALRSAGVLDAVNPKLVFGENVAQALQFVQSGAADAGIVALSLAAAPTVKGTIRSVPVPPELFPPLQQVAVVLKLAADVDAAMAVRRVLESPAGAAVLQRYGFVVPERR